MKLPNIKPPKKESYPPAIPTSERRKAIAVLATGLLSAATALGIAMNKPKVVEPQMDTRANPTESVIVNQDPHKAEREIFIKANEQAIRELENALRYEWRVEMSEEGHPINSKENRVKVKGRFYDSREANIGYSLTEKQKDLLEQLYKLGYQSPTIDSAKSKLNHDLEYKLKHNSPSSNQPIDKIEGGKNGLDEYLDPNKG